MKMSNRRAKSPGWAAFDLKQRQKEGFEREVDHEPYPPMSAGITPLQPFSNFVQENKITRPFTSVLLPAVKFPTLTDDVDHEKPLLSGNSSANQRNKFTTEPDAVKSYANLKELHSWADESLIADIMAAVNNDVEMASTLLMGMVPSENPEHNKDTNIQGSKSKHVHFPLDNTKSLVHEGGSFEEFTDLAGPSCVLGDALNSWTEELTSDQASCGNEDSASAVADMKLILGQLNSIPVEPEWEEDDFSNSVQENKITRPFTSVLLPAVKFPTLTDDVDHEKPLLSGNSSANQRNKFTTEPDAVKSYANLKELHSWADESLIADIMAAVNNDVEMASTLLMGMVPSENPEHNKDTNIQGSKSKHVHFPLDNTKSLVHEGGSFEEFTDLAGPSCVLGDTLNSWTEELTSDHASGGNEDSASAVADMKLILGQLNSIPVEPEWEEDDFSNSVQENKITRPFTSVLLPAVKFPTLTDDVDHEKPLFSGNSSANQRNKFTTEPDAVKSYANLKELHSWADESLIADIMAAVNNDVEMASTLLMIMVPSENPEHNKDTNIQGSKSEHVHFPLDNTKSLVHEGGSFEEFADLAGLSCVLGDTLNSWTEELTSDHASCGNEDSSSAVADMKLILGQLNSIPVEPEWEEYDFSNSVQENKITRPFTSVLLPAVKFPTLTDDVDHEKPLLSGNSSANQRNKFTTEPDAVKSYANLKELHSWADESLIADIMAAVNNDVEMASTLLICMVPSENPEHNKDTNIQGSKSEHVHFPLDNTKSLVHEGGSFEEFTDLAGPSCVLGDTRNSWIEELTSDHASCGNEDSASAVADMKLILGQLNSIPVEPEWEEDDIYLLHRKDALRMMRLASQHSRAARDAYLRSDHFSAQQFSMKAREERMAAEQLNAKAANAILSTRNDPSNLWKLDLHGLHAVEAVQALQERLQKLESLVPSDRSVSPNKKSERASMFRSASVESFSCVETSKLDEQRALSRQRSILLEVITGRGIHSRGLAVLPTAVRNFLNKNAYRYDEPRPGLITVRPKFRRLQ